MKNVQSILNILLVLSILLSVAYYLGHMSGVKDVRESESEDVYLEEGSKEDWLPPGEYLSDEEVDWYEIY
jgi:hypothetical protein